MVGYGATPTLSVVGSNVGIGVAAPSTKLHVNGGEIWQIYNGAQNRFVFGEGTGANQYGALTWNSSDNRVSLGTVTYMNAFNILDSNGYVGVGTTSPWKTLSVTGDMVLTGALFDSTSSAGTNGMVLQTDGSSTHWVATSTLGITSSQWTTNGANIYFNTGNVGIGSSSPNSKLVVGGEVVATYFTSTSTAATSTFAGNIVGGYTRNIFASNYSIAVGDASTGSTFAITASGNGSAAFGSLVPVVGSGAAITASGNGSLATGRVLSLSGTPTIVASGQGSVAHGHNQGSGSITASGNGAFAIGNLNANNITSSGAGSFAGGNGENGSIVSSGKASFAWGGNISATADYSVAFGAGYTNSTANTFQVGYSATPTLTVNSASVGIGTTTPSARLDVYGVAGANPAFRVSSSTNALMFTVNANGRVGVGSTTPGALFSVDSSTALPGTNRDNVASFYGLSGGAIADAVIVNVTGSYEFTGTNDIYGVRSAPSSSALVWNNAENNYAFYGNPTGGVVDWGLYITGEDKNYFSGSLGIGTTSPWKKFSVAGDMVLTGGLFDSLSSAGSNGMVLQSTGSATKWVATSTLGIASSLTGTTGQITYFDGTNSAIGTSSIFLATSGNVGIGTTSPASKLDVVGNITLSGSNRSILSGANGVGSYNLTIQSTDGGLVGTTGNVSFLSGASMTGGNSGTVTISSGAASGNSGALTLSTGAVSGTAGAITLSTGASAAGGNITVTTGGTVVGGNFSVSTANGSSVDGTISLTTADTGSITLTSGSTGNILLNTAGNNKVGVGSSTPYAKLSVKGVGVGTNPNFQTTDSNNTPLFTVLDNGNVGIGTTTPWKDLSVTGDMVLTGALFDSLSSAGTNGMVLQSTGTATKWVATSTLGIASSLTGTTGQVAYFSGSNTAIGTSSIFISTAGNVGVGETNPAYRLSNTSNPLDDWNSNGLSASGLGWYINEAGKYTMSAQNGTAGGYGMSIFANSSGNEKLLTLSNASADVVTFTANGRVGIGSTTPSTLLTVIGTSTMRSILPEGPFTTNISNYNLGASTARWSNIWAEFVNVGTSTWSLAGRAGGENRFAIFDAASGGGTERLTISDSGKVGIGSTSPYAKLSVTNTGTYPSFIVADSASDTTPFLINDNGDVFIGDSSYMYSDGSASFAYGNFTISSAGAVIASSLDLGDSATITTGNIQLAYGAGGVSDYGIKLNVDGTSQFQGLMFFGEQAGFTYIGASGSSVANTDVLTLGAGHGGLNISDGDLNTEYLSVLGSGKSNPGFIGVGSTTPWKKFSIAGDMVLTGALFDSLSSAGTNGMVLQSTGSATKWVATSTLGISGGASLTGTTGQIAYFSGTDTAAGTSTIFLSTAGNVGIGTTTPYGKLSVAIPSSTTVGLNIQATTSQSANLTEWRDSTGLVHNAITPDYGMSFQYDGSNPLWKLFPGNSGQILFRNVTSGTNPFVISSLGNFSSGATTEYGQFFINNDTASDPVLTVRGAAAQTGDLQRWQNSGITSLSVVNSSGYFGIGTSTPTNVLTVTDATASQLTLSAGTGISQWAFRNAGGNFYLSSTTVAGTATTTLPALTIIGSNGNVGVGTSSPWGQLSVNKAVGVNNDRIFTAGIAGNEVFGVGQYDDPANPAVYFKSPNGGTTPYVRLFAGPAGAGTFSFNGGFTYFNSSSGTIFTGAGPQIQEVNNNTPSSAATQVSSLPFEWRSEIWTGSTNANRIHQIYAAVSTTQNNVDRMAFVQNRANQGSASAYETLSLLYDGAISSGRVGIGSTTPWAKLSVNAIAADGTSPQFVVGSSTATNFIVANSGKVGIGTTSPREALDVNGNVNVNITGLTGSYQNKYGFNIYDNAGKAYLMRFDARQNTIADLEFPALSQLRMCGGSDCNTPTGRLDVNFATTYFNGTSVQFQSNPGVARSGDASSLGNQKDSYIMTFQPSVWNGKAAQMINYLYMGALTTQNIGQQYGITFNPVQNTWNSSAAALNTMFISANSRIGVNNTNPLASLDVTPKKIVQDAYFVGSGLSDMVVYNRDAYTGTETKNYRVKIDGTGSPNTFTWSNDGGATWMATGVSITGANQVLENGVTIRFTATTGHTLNDYWYMSALNPDAIAVKTSAGTTAFVVSKDGMIGAGTSTPWANFAVGTHNLAIATPSFIIASSSTGVATSTQFIIKNGMVGVGTTSPWRTLSVTGSVAFDGLTTAGSSGDAVCLSASKELIVNTGAQTCTVSSARFKDNIAPISSGLDTILKLNPVTFTYKDATDEHIGLIAEEVNAVEPRLIFTESDGTTPRGVRYEDLAALTVSAVKSLAGVLEVTQDPTTGQFISERLNSIEDRVTILENNSGTSTAISAKLGATVIGGQFEVADTSIEGGDIVAVDTSQSSTVTKAQAYSDAFGVVAFDSTTFTSTSLDTDATRSVVSAGQTPVKFSNANGEIKAGDFITMSSTTPGVAVKATETGTVIGTALENATGTAGRVMVAVKVGFQKIEVSNDQVVTDLSSLSDSLNALIAGTKKWMFGTITVANGLFKNVFADRIQTKTLCLDDVCVNKTQLQQLLQQGGVPSTSGTTGNGGTGTTTPPTGGTETGTTTPPTTGDVGNGGTGTTTPPTEPPAPDPISTPEPTPSGVVISDTPTTTI